VANIPGAVPKTSTYALTGVTLPYILKIASLGVNKALISDQSLMRGLNTYKGFLTCKGVAEAQNLMFTGPEELLSH
jgi:alanine dehydrogenase